MINEEVNIDLILNGIFFNTIIDINLWNVLTEELLLDLDDDNINNIFNTAINNTI